MKLIELFSFRKEEIQRNEGPRSAVVALGGGGARGLSHLGALEAITDAGIRLERIVGVSMGSLVGAMCAITPDIKQVQTQALRLLTSEAFEEKCGTVADHAKRLAENEKESQQVSWYGGWYDWIKQSVTTGRRLRRAMTSHSLMRDNLLRDAVEHLIPDIDIQDTTIPLSIVVADLLSGHRVVLERGSLRDAIMASTAIPGFFPPVQWGNHLLCDVGVLDSLPVMVAQSYATDLVIGVDVGNAHTAIQECSTAIEVMMRMDEIAERIIRRQSLEMADIKIRPDVGYRAWFDFSNPQVLIEKGHHAGLAAIRSYWKSHLESFA